MSTNVAVRQNIEDVAMAVRKWASDNNLLRLGGSLSVSPRVERLEGAIAMSDEAIGILERQKVTAVGFNRRQKKIFIYTNRVVSKRSQVALPKAFQDAFQIEYKQAKPVTIDMEGSDEVFSKLPYSQYGRYYACGSSIGVGSVRMAGTLGCLVRDREGTIHGLTNNHVTGGCNNTRLSMPIVAPGIKDVAVGGQDPFTIGYHHAVLTMRQGEPGSINHFENTDAALFRIFDPELVCSMQGNVYDTPPVVADPLEDMVVEKVGRTTGHTAGVIESELTGSLPVSYKTIVHHNSDESSQFVGTVHFEPAYLVRGNSGAFSLPGDSGSLVTTVGEDGRRQAVGLVFAGIAPDTSYILPLKPILERFGVELVSEHNAFPQDEDGGNGPGDS